MKSSGAMIDESQRIVCPQGCERLLSEVELGVVFGRTTSNVSRENALDHVAGYTIALDMTAGDILVSREFFGFFACSQTCGDFILAVA